MGGDLNIVGDPSIDASTTKGQSRPALNPLLHDLDLFDVWRAQHGSERDYMYFSHSQLSYSRLDAFIVDKWTLQNVTQSDIGLISWSDHAPISISLGDQRPGPPRLWRLDPSLLEDPKVRQEIEAEHQSFFEHNEPPDTVQICTLVNIQSVPSRNFYKNE